MWRLFHGLPRVASRQWNSSVVSTAPQTACRENGATNQHGFHSSAVLPVIHQDRQSHNHRWYYYEEQKTGKGGKKSRTTDCDWDEWFRSFNYCWSTGQPRIVEAVGWGTAVLLGLHLSQYYKLWNCNHVRKHPTDTGAGCMGYYLHQLALTMPFMASPGGMTHYMLPPSPQNLAIRDSVTGEEKEEHDSTNRRDMLQLNPWVESFLEEVMNERAVQHEASASVSCSVEQDVLAEGRDSWSYLDKLYQASYSNLQAYDCVGMGDLDRAISLWERSVELPTSSYNLGLCHQLGLGMERNEEMAVIFYRQASSQGHHKATYNMARMYLHGQGVPKDVSQAMQLLEQAADNGVTKAQCDLAVLYSTIEKDMEKAVPLFEKAAQNKDGCGVYNLAVCYHHGLGVHQNVCKATELYRQAAGLGDTQAQLMLAHLFKHGLAGLPVDEQCASEWIAMAENETQSTESESRRSSTETPLDQHISATSRYKATSPASHGSLFYIDSSDSDLSDSGTSMSSDMSSDVTLASSLNDDLSDSSMQHSPMQGSIRSIPKSKSSTNQIQLQIEKEEQFPIQEGHFGEFLPKIPLTGSFGVLPRKKSGKLGLRRNQQPKTVADFRHLSDDGEVFRKSVDRNCDMLGGLSLQHLESTTTSGIVGTNPTLK